MSLAPPSPRSPLLLALLFSPALQADDLFLDSETLPSVLMATHLKQTPAQVPGSMNELDNELSDGRSVCRAAGLEL